MIRPNRWYSWTAAWSRNTTYWGVHQQYSFERHAMLINFPYVNRNSALHRLDPRSKLILLFAFGFAAAQTSNAWFMFLGLIGAIFYYSQGHLRWIETRRAWIFIIFLNFFLVIGNYFISGGAIVQGVDLSHPHVLFSLPFFVLKSQPSYIGPGPLV